MREISLDRAHLSGLAAEILTSGGTFRFRATGGSMTPFIKDGDILEVRPVATAAIRRADVVLYRREQHGGLVAHRVVDLNPGSPHVLSLQGDASLFDKETVASTSVLGRVVNVQRNDKVMTLDAGPWYWLGWGWVALSPFSRRLYRMLVGCKSMFRLDKPRCGTTL